MSAYDQLSNKQRRFVDVYLVQLNATAAATIAGYGPKRPEIAGCKLLANPRVRDAVEERMLRARERTEIDEAWVLERLRLVVERCMQAEPAGDCNGDEIGQFRFDASGANRALELIGKHFAMFTDRVQVAPLEDLTDDELDERINDKLNALGMAPASSRNR